MQWFNDTDGRAYSGIMTHEFGHAANLSHSQANGSVYNDSLLEYPWPNLCPPGPPGRSFTPDRAGSRSRPCIPSSTTRSRGSGEFQFTWTSSTTSRASRTSIPSPAGPRTTEAIQGTIRSLTKILGNGRRPHAGDHQRQPGRAQPGRSLQRLHLHRLRRADPRRQRSRRDLRDARPHPGRPVRPLRGHHQQGRLSVPVRRGSFPGPRSGTTAPSRAGTARPTTAAPGPPSRSPRTRPTRPTSPSTV
jgi:hypothetical protein